MKANRNAKGMQNDRAEVGIGTLIVFIAAVLVAAVAAAVLINTSGQLQERGQATGQEATKEVSSNLKLFGVWANRAGATGPMDALNITIGTGPASQPIDLSNTTVVISSASSLITLSYKDAAPGANQFNASKVRDADNSYSGAVPVMTAGDLVTVWIDLGSGANDIPLNPGDRLSIKFVPPVGTPLLSDIVMPQTFGTDTLIQVR